MRVISVTCSPVGLFSSFDRRPERSQEIGLIPGLKGTRRDVILAMARGPATSKRLVRGLKEKRKKKESKEKSGPS